MSTEIFVKELIPNQNYRITERGIIIETILPRFARTAVSRNEQPSAR